jgi:RHS repeat-associated protein
MPEDKKEEKTISAPQISLPKGGGAIRGIGEKFQVNPVTGTASLNVPIYTTPGRSDFYPKLSLSYDSGSGNGPFGLGWNLSIPTVTRKTDKGLPKYQDGDESDTFILSGSEDLVPELEEKNGQLIKYERDDLVNGEKYKVYRYRPRIEGLFARIERWKRISDGDVYWKSISKDNVTSIYGKSPESRIFDPDDNLRVFSWLLEESYDDKGNVILYQYKQENDDNTDPSLPQEKNRIGGGYANRYLKRIKYCNKIPRSENQEPDPETDYLFEIVFDYGEHDLNNPHTSEDELWPIRRDSFSSYRAGFEIRTQRLCRRILMFHHFPDELPLDPYLVRSTDFNYEETPVLTYLSSVKQFGYIWNEEKRKYQSKSLPPLEFTYSKFQLNDEVRFIDEESLENLPQGIDGSQYQLIDLDGEGISGILTQQGEGWFYKHNLGNFEFELVASDIDGPPEPPVPVALGSVRFAPSRLVANKPSLANLYTGQTQIMDLAGDGQKDLVLLDEPVSGFFERTHDKKWESFVPFSSYPRINWKDPNLRLIDLNGDGHTDILISENDVFAWYPSKAEEGFGSAESVRKKLDEEKGPALIFADATQSVYLADMSGDGLTDIVRIRNGEVCYWPNLGYGRFGAKITMDRAPYFDSYDQFNQNRIRLADIDGSGTTDIIYLSRNGIQFWFNQSGNGWSETHFIDNFPLVDNLSSVMVADLLGNGTACILWSSPLPKNDGYPLCYIDLAGSSKPHLMKSIDNNMGAEIHFEYASSTRFYLEDLAAGKHWITRLPFPVHVVERVETRELVTDTKLVTLYKYHHGYFDGEDREFRGFGMVEQWDSESYKEFNKGCNDLAGFQTQEEEFHLPPVYTKTWFHTGFYRDREHISRQYEEEYYKGDPQNVLLPDTILPDGLSAEEEYEACRALKGRILRHEIYAVDDSEKSKHPYKVTESNYKLRCIQKINHNLKHAVFYTYAFETLDYYYERNPDDPRINHNMVLEVDQYGNETDSVAIGYPRRNPQYDEQGELKVLYTRADFINEDREESFYYIGIPYQTRNYEVTGLGEVWSPGELLTCGDFDQVVENPGNFKPYSWERPQNHTGIEKRIVEWSRSYFRKNEDFNIIDIIGRIDHRLDLGEINLPLLPYETYQAAFSQEMLENIYPNGISAETLVDKGGYHPHPDIADAEVDAPGMWWIPSGRQEFDPGKFYLPVRIMDPFGNEFKTFYDNYSLLIKHTEDPHENRVETENDYRVMQPCLLTDPNGNRSEVAFDILGMVAGAAVMGKEGEAKGDSMEGFNPNLNEEAVVDNPFENAHEILGQATTRLVYDAWRFYKSRQENPDDRAKWQPVVVLTMVREIHVSELPDNEQTKIQYSFTYSDGFGREVQTKIQAEPGEVNGAFVEKRWVSTGLKIYNNKGNPVKQFEPFFSNNHLYGVEEHGVSPLIFYDPLERVVATLYPNHTYEKGVFDPWHQETWDVNDTVSQANPKDDPDVGRYFNLLPEKDYLPTWYERMISGTPEEQEAAEKAIEHAGTPNVVHLDIFGRTFLTIADNGLDEEGNPQKYETRVVLDIEGNQKEITDPRLNRVMQYSYDMLSNQVYQNSMDAGKRWKFSNVAGNVVKQWDERNHEITFTYDKLQRPSRMHVTDGDGTVPLDSVYEKINYGDFPGMGTAERNEAKQLNLIGKPKEHYDTAGRVTIKLYDFKGNLKESTRQLLSDYKNIPDWTGDDLEPLLDQEPFNAEIEYDALNRVIRTKTPDGRITIPVYNDAGLLEKVEVTDDGETKSFVKNIDYNEKGQRTLIIYGNDMETSYEYDTETFRLTHLETFRANNSLLQDLYYTYDPIGNITQIEDKNIPEHFFNNERIEGVLKYRYDPIYRLVEASGREHIGQVEFGEHDNWNDSPFLKKYSPGDDMAWRNYTQSYQYDEVGNIKNMRHVANGGSWTRNYEYSANNNRLVKTIVGVNNNDYNYTYHPQHGFMTGMPHLEVMKWNFKDELRAVVKQKREDGGTPETTYYVYDSAGQRVRKVTENTSEPGGIPSKKCERIYVAGVEFYREHTGNHSGLERKTLHILDDTRRISMIETRNDINDGSSKKLIRYQLSNHLGSAYLETDDSVEARLISYEEYHPYGTTAYQAMNEDIQVPLKRYRYTGKERDVETGLYYHGARYYVSWLGRWISVDPAPVNNSSNLYAYAADSPIVFYDSTGFQEEHGILSKIKYTWGRFYRAVRLSMELFAPVIRPSLNNVDIPQTPIEQPAEPVRQGRELAVKQERAAKMSSVPKKIPQITGGKPPLPPEPPVQLASPDEMKWMYSKTIRGRLPEDVIQKLEKLRGELPPGRQTINPAAEGVRGEAVKPGAEPIKAGGKTTLAQKLASTSASKIFAVGAVAADAAPLILMSSSPYWCEALGPWVCGWSGEASRQMEKIRKEEGHRTFRQNWEEQMVEIVGPEAYGLIHFEEETRWLESQRAKEAGKPDPYPPMIKPAPRERW